MPDRHENFRRHWEALLRVHPLGQQPTFRIQPSRTGTGVRGAGYTSLLPLQISTGISRNSKLVTSFSAKFLKRWRSGALIQNTPSVLN